MHFLRVFSIVFFCFLVGCNTITQIADRLRIAPVFAFQLSPDVIDKDGNVVVDENGLPAISDYPDIRVAKLLDTGALQTTRITTALGRLWEDYPIVSLYVSPDGSHLATSKETPFSDGEFRLQIFETGDGTELFAATDNTMSDDFEAACATEAIREALYPSQTLEFIPATFVITYVDDLRANNVFPLGWLGSERLLVEFMTRYNVDVRGDGGAGFDENLFGSFYLTLEPAPEGAWTVTDCDVDQPTTVAPTPSSLVETGGVTGLQIDGKPLDLPPLTSGGRVIKAWSVSGAFP